MENGECFHNYLICKKRDKTIYLPPFSIYGTIVNIHKFFLGIFLLLFFASCNYTKNLTKDEYALKKNSIKIEGVKGTQFDDLIYLVRPIPNKKFMDIFPIKVSLWTYHQPKIDSVSGKTKDTKFNKWLRERGEPTVLLDSNDRKRSIAQIELALFQNGYFDAQVQSQVLYLKKQKARVNYTVTPNQPYTIRKIDYQIEIPEYKRIVITDTANSWIKKGMIYNEELFVAERNRIISLIKDQGYFYATTSIVTFLVDTIQAFEHLNAKGNPTVAITIRVSFDELNDESLISKSVNRYRFNDVLINTNYDLNFDKNINLDTIYYLDFRNKSDSTLYKFVTLKKLKRKTNRVKLIKDYTSRTIAGAIWMKKGEIYSQTAYDRTSKKLRDLRNFTMINISYNEEEKLWDSIHKTGVLNTNLRLTRAKQNSVGADFDLRTDRTTLGVSYANKNIFRGAELLSINAYGSVYYYNWINWLIKKIDNGNLIFGEVGGSASLEFPRLLMLPKYQNVKLWSYATEIRFSVNYLQLYSRLNLQASYTYKWSPTRFLAHSISPIELATLDSRSNRANEFFNFYPESYQRKFDKFFLPSAKYTLNYTPVKSIKHAFQLYFSYETVGLLLYGTNMAVNKDNMWKVFNSFNYGTFQKFDLNLNYTGTINKNNSFATRFMLGMAIPYKKGTVIPFERSFFVGGANSMRGWTFRQLGPGGFYSKEIIDRVGDMRLEFNLEYRGTIYKAFKFGIFSDMGNVWLLSKYEDMPNAEFNFNSFYKQIAVCVGLGLRIDFSFFIVRLDYGLPIYDPSNPVGNYWINNKWKKNGWWKETQGIQFGINYAF
ncbi:MAG: outer membrane protein assembly factor [Lentimicrobiaceae bacterium]|nr:outer membrane protein assembly factor [Lentimicrobiaceae bacterium]